MSADERLAKLEAERDFYRAKVLELAEDARLILHEDLEAFVQRKVKETFLAGGEQAAALGDEALKALKRDTAERAAAARDAILAALADHDPWLDPGDLPDDARGLEANRRVWEEIAPIGDVIVALLKAHGLPAPDQPPAYQEPRRFIHSRLLTTVTEKYWSTLRSYRHAQAEIEAIAHARHEDALSRRWDEV